MAKTKATDLPIDLREFIKEHDQRVYDFCSYLLAADFALDDLILPIFREFGEYYRRVHRVGGSTVSSSQLQVRLFQIAWQGVQNSFQRAVFSNNGRDTRLLKGLEDDILPSKPENLEKVAAKSENRVADRLGRVDTELRAAVILRDILKFDDEEAAKILGLRWGVYRHRLHRGRLDFKDALRGLPTGHPADATA